MAQQIINFRFHLNPDILDTKSKAETWLGKKHMNYVL